MNIWTKRAAQAEIEAAGITVRVNEYPGLSFRVRPLCEWNKDYQLAQIAIARRPEVMAYLERAKSPGYVFNDADRALDADMVRDAFADGCVISWSGVPSPKGAKNWPHNTDNARTFLAAFPDIYHALRREAGNLANFAPKTTAEKLELVEGN